MSIQVADSVKAGSEVDPLRLGVPLPVAHVLSQVDPPSSSKPPVHVGIYLQDDCLKHRFIRSRDATSIVERPERLRAVKVGLAAAIARIEEALVEGAPKPSDENASVEEELTAALGKMNIVTSDGTIIRTRHISVTRSTATVDLLDNAAVKYVHGDIDGDVYLQNLKIWARDSEENITKRGSEIPEGIPPFDLYLCPSSIEAIQGAIGAVCQAVDAVIVSTPCDVAAIPPQPQRAFVAVRPPGHHCGEDSPSGFCLVNNVAIGAAHAHLKHGIQRVVILDIDLHHGNGTQSIACQINEETYRQTLESEHSPSNVTPPKLGPQIFYGSIHDVLSFPCEDGKMSFVQAASTSIHGPHGQYIENIHLQPYSSETYFWDVLYKELYSALFKRASQFLDSTGGPGDDVMVFISCGFDACEYEYPNMSRHDRKVPTSFYHRFTLDTCAFADVYARGRVVSVLEGGYSDRALISGAMAHLCGLMGDTIEVDQQWWDVESLVKLEKATKHRKLGRASLGSIAPEPWLTRTSELLLHLDIQRTPPQQSRNWVPPAPTSMTLRERKKPLSNSSTPEVSRQPAKGTQTPAHASKSPTISASASESEAMSTVTARKVPRVILHVRPPTTGGS